MFSIADIEYFIRYSFNRRLKHNLERRGIVQAVPGAPPFAAPQKAPTESQSQSPQEPAQKRAASRKH